MKSRFLSYGKCSAWRRLMPGLAMLAGLWAFSISPAAYGQSIIGDYYNVGWGEVVYSPNLMMPPSYLLQFTDGQSISPNTIGAVSGDLTVNLDGITGTANGATGYVTMTQLVLSNNTGEVTLDILPTAPANFTSVVTPPNEYFGQVNGTAMINLAASTSPTLEAALAPYSGGAFALHFQNIAVPGNGPPSLDPPNWQPVGQYTLATAQPVPEGSSLVMAGTGVVIVSGYWWRRRRKSLGADGKPPDDSPDDTGNTS